MIGNNKIICEGYDFVDFGCSNGNSISRYGEIFQAKGLGLDIDKVRSAKERGLDIKSADLTKLRLGSKVSFVTMHHFLEHIPNINDLRKIIRGACENASDFILIRQPYFDADAYLLSEGFKLYWSDWSGPPNNMTSLDFHNLLRPLVSEGLTKDFKIYSNRLIESSEMLTFLKNIFAEISIGK